MESALSAAGLCAVHCGIFSVQGDPSVFDQHDQIRIADCGQSTSDDEVHASSTDVQHGSADVKYVSSGHYLELDFVASVALRAVVVGARYALIE